VTNYNRADPTKNAPTLPHVCSPSIRGIKNVIPQKRRVSQKRKRSLAVAFSGGPLNHVPQVLKARKCGALAHVNHPLVNLSPFAVMNRDIENVNPEATLGGPTMTAEDYTRVLASQNINHPPIAAMNSDIENVNPKETSIGTTMPAMLDSHNINLPPFAAMDRTRVLDVTVDT
jgi:hypothetical protein